MPKVTLAKNLLLAQHHMLHQHEIGLECVDIIDRAAKWKQILFIEALHSVQEQLN